MLWDISRTLDGATPQYPGDPHPEFRRGTDVEKGDAFSFTHIRMHSHCGTHIDAPAHFIAGGKTVGSYSLSDLCPLVEVIDCRGIGEISSEVLESKVKAPGKAVLLRTDTPWEEDAAQVPGLPGLTIDAAQWLCSRSARLLGIDMLSVENGNEDYPVHQLLLSNGFLLLENLDLRQVNAGVYRLICLPLKIANAEAAPCRAMLTDNLAAL